MRQEDFDWSAPKDKSNLLKEEFVRKDGDKLYGREGEIKGNPNMELVGEDFFSRWKEKKLLDVRGKLGTSKSNSSEYGLALVTERALVGYEGNFKIEYSSGTFVQGFGRLIIGRAYFGGEAVTIYTAPLDSDDTPRSILEDIIYNLGKAISPLRIECLEKNEFSQFLKFKPFNVVDFIDFQNE